MGGAPASRVSDNNPDLAQYAVISNPGRLGVGALFAVTGQIGIDQPGIPLARYPRTSASAACALDGRVDDQHVRPLDQPFQNLPCVWRLQIERHSALVAIVEMPRIVIVRSRLWRKPVDVARCIAESEVPP